MKKIKTKITKSKNQVIVVPTTQKTKSTKTLVKNKKVTKKTVKLRPIRSKENTLAYYNCLIDQVTKNDKVKITKLCNWCRGNKGKVAWAKSENKQELVEKVAQGYLEFGKGLGHLLHADIVGCKCK